MRRILKLFLAFVFMSIILTACDEENCAICYLVTYENDVETDRDNGVEYCGAELTLKQLSTPVVIGDTKTQWECD